MSTARLWPRVSAASISLRDSPTDRLAALPCGTICELVWTRPGADPRPGWKGVLDVRATCQAAPSPAQVAVWSVGNPADSRPGVIVARSNHALGLRGAPWLPSCCSSPMNHGELRARIRQLIASGDLPAVPPLASGTLSAPAGIRRVIIGRSLPDPWRQVRPKNAWRPLH